VRERVVIKTLNHCGHCEAGYRGDDNQCTGVANARCYDGIPAAGGLAQYIAMPVSRVFPIDQDLSPEEAAFAEPVACCVRSMERADIQRGEDVVIVGAGIMGQLHNLLAKIRGARTILVEPDAERRALALSAWARISTRSLADNPCAIKCSPTDAGAHVVFITTAMTRLAAEYIAALGKMGGSCITGLSPDGDIAVNPTKSTMRKR
jgi:L-iditol 2-dehydrogenase